LYGQGYSATWDNLAKGVTIAIFLILISLGAVLILISRDLVLATAVVTFFSLILFLPYLWAPRGYVLDSDCVIVQRAIGDVKIRIAQLPSRWNWTWWGLRLLGSGGLYGYFGVFTFKGAGRVRMHATDRRKLVLVTDVKGRKYLLSPDDPEDFIQRAKALPTLRMEDRTDRGLSSIIRGTSGIR